MVFVGKSVLVVSFRAYQSPTSLVFSMLRIGLLERLFPTNSSSSRPSWRLAETLAASRPVPPLGAPSVRSTAPRPGTRSRGTGRRKQRQQSPFLPPDDDDDDASSFPRERCLFCCASRRVRRRSCWSREGRRRVSSDISRRCSERSSTRFCDDNHPSKSVSRIRLENASQKRALLLISRALFFFFFFFFFFFHRDYSEEA